MSRSIEYTKCETCKSTVGDDEIVFNDWDKEENICIYCVAYCPNCNSQLRKGQIFTNGLCICCDENY